jgi:transcriptional regulator with XRE-family HTH domain
MARNMTAREAALQIGISPNFLSSIMQGQKKLPPQFSQRVATALALTAEHAHALDEAHLREEDERAATWLRSRGWKVMPPSQHQ